jgi:hypothetical protein
VRIDRSQGNRACRGGLHASLGPTRLAYSWRKRLHQKKKKGGVQQNETSCHEPITPGGTIWTRASWTHASKGPRRHPPRPSRLAAHSRLYAVNGANHPMDAKTEALSVTNMHTPYQFPAEGGEGGERARCLAAQPMYPCVRVGRDSASRSERDAWERTLIDGSARLTFHSALTKERV